MYISKGILPVPLANSIEHLSTWEGWNIEYKGKYFVTKSHYKNSRLSIRTSYKKVYTRHELKYDFFKFEAILVLVLFKENLQKKSEF